MKIAGSVALVTGANRGIGRRFALELLDRGATVYATARTPGSIDVPGVRTLALDITDPASIAAAAVTAPDVDLVINNAGVSTYSNLVTGDLAKIRLEMDTHFFGTLGVIRAFAPVLAANGGGAILNVLSVLSWLNIDGANAYAAAKAAEWSLTGGVRLELAGHGTQVMGLHMAAVDTDMMAGFDVPKADPADIVRAALDGVEAGRTEVLADEAAVATRAGLGS